jgi:hypothetical protein
MTNMLALFVSRLFLKLRNIPRPTMHSGHAPVCTCLWLRLSGS